MKAASSEAEPARASSSAVLPAGRSRSGASPVPVVSSTCPALVRRQEEGHVDVAEVDQVQHPAAGREDLSRRRDAVLDPAVARREEGAAIHVGLDALDRGVGLVDRRGRVHDLRLGRPDRGVRGGDLRLCRADRRFRGLVAGAVAIQFLLGDGASGREVGGAPEPSFGSITLGLALGDRGNGGLAFGLSILARRCPAVTKAPSST